MSIYGCVHDLSKMLLLECPIMIFSPFSYHTCSYIVHFQKCQLLTVKMVSVNLITFAMSSLHCNQPMYG